jgi:hypothetical protein
MSNKHFRRHFPLALAWLAGFALPAAAATELGIEGAKFTIDGKPTFLLGISYYGALGASPETIQRDLDDMQRLDFNWIRVWATWSGFGNDVSAVDGEGRAREAYLSALKRLASECDRRGMIVDVTLSRGNGAAGSPRLQGLAAHRRAVETLVSALKAQRNWYLDLGNERNIRDKRYVSFDELKQLCSAAKQIDPKRLITASHAGDLTRQDVKEYLDTVRVDFLSPHGDRGPKIPSRVEAEARQYAVWVKEHGRVVPVHYQEPFRRGYTGGWEPSAEEFVTAAVGARSGGAAGWCFHNGSQRGTPDGKPRRSFDLSEKRLFEQLDEVEQRTVRELHRAFSATGEPRP